MFDAVSGLLTAVGVEEEVISRDGHCNCAVQ